MSAALLDFHPFWRARGKCYPSSRTQITGASALKRREKLRWDGSENDAATGIILMAVMRRLAKEIGCFVLGVAHLGKNPEAGTRGAGSKEDAADVVWVCLGEKALSGSVTNTRMAVRKCRGGPQGQQYPFAPRIVAAPEPDEDGDPVTTLVIDWQPGRPGGAAVHAPTDPWEASCRRGDQMGRVLRLRDALTDALTEHGTELPIPPDGPTVRMVGLEFVRQQFYSRTPEDSDQRRKQFSRALDHAQQKQLIGVRDIDGAPHLWLCRVEDDPRG